MSGYLWKFYLENDVDNFRRLLETANYTTKGGTHKVGNTGNQNVGLGIGSPGSLERRESHAPPIGAAVLTLTRADLNHRDTYGRTLLHLAASSNSKNAFDFAAALLEHVLTDVYIQDLENGWTALHRAFYAGNAAIAQSILARDMNDALGHGTGSLHQHTGGLIRIKDKEGNGPFDLFEMSLEGEITKGTLRNTSGDASDSDDESMPDNSDDRGLNKNGLVPYTDLEGDEVYTFGSNKNVTLGFGDEDDRQHPERITLKRPDHLYFRFYREHMEARAKVEASESGDLAQSGLLQPQSVSELPSVIRNRPIIIQNMHMAKLHSAVLTNDPESNLYICGHGPGGRLGVGDETTRFQFVCVEGGALARKKVVAIALGQDHTLALSDEGDIFAWGSNGFGQLGYDLPKASGREESVQTLPRQLFGQLKREIVIGVAASRIHSVAHTSTSLYTFGKNEGQLGLVDSDARSLEVQDTPRKVGVTLFSSSIRSASAIDRATTCLLENGEVWVFANYGYARLTFPLDGFTNYFLRASFRTTKYESSPNSITQVLSGGDTICAMTTSGEVFTVAVRQPGATSSAQSKSTTNPSKIKSALSQPLRVWSNKKSHMAARDVDVDQSGAIILATEAGSVWRRVKRAKIKDASASGTGEYKPKDYKFSRISGLTRVTAVRASGFGAYAAVREDCKKTRTEIQVSASTLWTDLWPLAPFQTLYPADTDAPSFPQRDLIDFVLKSEDPEEDIVTILEPRDAPILPYDLMICSTTSDVRIPMHQFIFTARSRVIRQALDQLNEDKSYAIPDLLVCRKNEQGKLSIIFQGLDTLTIFNLVLYLYADSLAAVWSSRSKNMGMQFRYRQTRTELLKLATRLDLGPLETCMKRIVPPSPALDKDLKLAFKDPSFFDSGDVVVRLAEDEEAWVHGALVCQRCPFFEGLFKGQAGGRWLASRRQQLKSSDDAVPVDLTHIQSSVFQWVLRHIYADTGPELFDDVVADDVDLFLDVVIDVLAVANELMLHRLSEICQKVVGEYVTVRNVCQLINAVAPSLVTTFKMKALEYICYNLEAVLQHGRLDELDDDLFIELDATAHRLQANCSIFARSGVAEEGLFEKYPDLKRRIAQEQQAKIDSILLLNKYGEVDAKGASSYRAGSFHERYQDASQTPKTRRKSSNNLPAGIGSPSPSASPALKSRRSAADLMFEMDDEDDESEDDSGETTPTSNLQERLQAVASSSTQARNPNQATSKQWSIDQPQTSPFSQSTEEIVSPGSRTPATTSTETRPWGATSLSSSKLGLQEIMAQATSSRTSNISLGLSGPSGSERKTSGSFKPSQKERKKQQQQQAVKTAPVIPIPTSSPSPASPWQIHSAKPKSAPTKINTDALPAAQSPASPRTPHLTMRQTVANPSSSARQKAPTPTAPSQPRNISNTPSLPTASPAPSASVSSAKRPSSSRGTPTIKSSSSKAKALDPTEIPGFSISDKPVPIQSVRHTPQPIASSSAVQLTMEEILSHQLIEKTVIKDFAAKRSLQEIQQEQEFQEWWDKEAARVREEEEMAAGFVERGGASSRGGRGKRRGRGGKADGGSRRPKGKGRPDGDGSVTAGPAQPPECSGMKK
ncbi:hypothetical protein EJ08DRAFT_668519 [Tothia fuscella]|uniref:BTB domain-containing protein n=1 Tax=Tothia fuscella TaxID=1048955 RepID=A0A9P4NZ35_9PEZI|nr:hypothetical protein EJ08DRAFT_668519 [Tothia fuscella]